MEVWNKLTFYTPKLKYGHEHVDHEHVDLFFFLFFFLHYSKASAVFQQPWAVLGLGSVGGETQ